MISVYRVLQNPCNTTLDLRSQSEEVGHGHVTYVRKRIHAVSLWRFVY